MSNAPTTTGDGPTFERSLGFFDVVNMTVGAIVGADIYIAAAITAGMLGPASLLAWAVAGVLATLLALTLAECARLVPDVGGPFTYANHAFGPMMGFLAGWSMWVAELMAMPVFAIAFTSYLGYFIHLDHLTTHALRIGFLVALTAVNVVSVRAAGRMNDALTLLKLAPLLLLVVCGGVYLLLHWQETQANLTPFAPFGLTSFPSALLLVFWAYAGFELSTVPSGEIKDPEHTVPRALAMGMVIVTAFYLSTNVVLYALLPYDQLAGTSTPLVSAAKVVLGGIGAAILAAGAVISVSGSDESDMLGASRLGFAMSAHGLLPKPLAAIHPRFHTPYVALIAQATVAICLTFVDQLSSLITFAVFNLAFTFLICALALIKLHRGLEQPPKLRVRLLPFVAAAIAIGLIGATSLQNKIEGVGVLLAGLAFFIVVGPGEIVAPAMHYIHQTENDLRFMARRRMRFLGGLVGWLGGHRSP